MDTTASSPPATVRAPVAAAFLAACFALLFADFVRRGTFMADGQLVATLFDDALISMRYAHNLVAGHGLVWNPGESPPVEGYTNLGWTLVMATQLALWPRELAPLAISVLGILILGGSAWLAGRIVREAGAGGWIATAAAAMVLACFPFVFWTLRGMEVGLVALLLLAAVWRLARADAAAGLAPRELALVASLAGAAFLVRNDSLVLFATALALAVPLRAWTPARALALAPLAAAIAIQLLVRFGIYGEWVPNTYVLKMTGVPLTSRLAAGVTALTGCLPAVILPLALLAAGLLAGPPDRATRLLRVGAALFAVQAAYLVWIGGDAWLIDHSNRFMATVAPVLLLCAALAVARLARAPAQGRAMAALATATGAAAALLLATDAISLGPRSNWPWLAGVGLAVAALVACVRGHTRFVGGMAIAALLLGTAGPGWLRYAFLGAPAVRDDIAFARQALLLQRTLPADAVLAATWLGAPSYFTSFATVDILGKVDKHVARLPGKLPFVPGHNKMDLPYTLGTLRPDVVLFDAPVAAQFGYVRLPNGLWMRSSPGLLPRAAQLGRSWCTSEAESGYCPPAEPAAPQGR